MWEAMPRTSDGFRELARKYETAGCDELIFIPSIADVNQVLLLAEAVLKK